MAVRTISLTQIIGIAAITAAAAAVLVPLGIAQGGTRGDAKTWHMTQLHILGQNFASYTNDWDDVLPLAFTRRPTDGTWAWNSMVPSPADGILNAPWQEPARIEQARSVWRNSLSSYAAVGTFLPGAPDHVVLGDMYAGVPNSTAPTMNGLLHSYNVNSIPSPSKVTLLWPGNGRVNLKGRAFSNPSLQCMNSFSPCLFDPNGSAGGPGGSWFWINQNAPTWIFGQGGPIVRMDLSVAMVPLGTAITPDISNSAVDPFAQVNASGVPISMWYCMNPNGQATYPCHFRPDRTE